MLALPVTWLAGWLCEESAERGQEGVVLPFFFFHLALQIWPRELPTRALPLLCLQAGRQTHTQGARMQFSSAPDLETRAAAAALLSLILTQLLSCSAEVRAGRAGEEVLSLLVRRLRSARAEINGCEGNNCLPASAAN